MNSNRPNARFHVLITSDTVSQIRFCFVHQKQTPFLVHFNCFVHFTQPTAWINMCGWMLEEVNMFPQQRSQRSLAIMYYVSIYAFAWVDFKFSATKKQILLWAAANTSHRERMMAERTATVSRATFSLYLLMKLFTGTHRKNQTHLMLNSEYTSTQFELVNMLAARNDSFWTRPMALQWPERGVHWFISSHLDVLMNNQCFHFSIGSTTFYFIHCHPAWTTLD